MKDVQAITGDPLKERATFTRFVLPFSYHPTCLCVATPDKGLPFFREATSQDWLHSATAKCEDEIPYLDGARRRYCTAEIADLLYGQKHAKWFILESPESRDVGPNIWKEAFPIPAGMKGDDETLGYSIIIRPPAVILFELSPPENIGKTNAVTDVFRTGFLVVEIFFDSKKPVRFEDVLRFNELFRYIRKPYFDHRSKDNERELCGMHKAMGGQTEDIYGEKWRKLLETPFSLEGRTFSLGIDWDQIEKWLGQPDDRAFTFTAAFVDQPLEGKLSSPVHKTIGRNFVSGAEEPGPGAGHWVKLLNVDIPSRAPIDASGDEACTRFEFEWALSHTYQRWAHYGTLFGFTSHSFALLAGKADEEFGKPPLSLHAGQIYFDLTLLVFYVRCGLFRFSKKLHDLSSRVYPHVATNQEVWQEEFTNLRKGFTLFENLYQWPILSNQQQHLEIYAIQREAMDTKELYEEIRKEIQSSDELFNVLVDQRRAKTAEMLNWIAGAGLLIGILLAAAQVFYGGQGNSWAQPFGWDEAALVSVALTVITFGFIAFIAIRNKFGK